MKHNWVYKRLGEVCSFIGGGTPSKSNGVYYSGNIPWATVRDMVDYELTTTELKITPEATSETATNLLPKGMIVISTHVGLGKICELMQDTAINQDLKGIKFSDQSVNKHYFVQWYRSIAEYIKENGRGATVKGVTLDFMRNLSIPVPPMEVQEQIVAELDKINEIISDSKEAICNLDTLAQSLFYDYFGDPITNPKGWEICKLGDRFETGSGGTPSKTVNEYWEYGDIPWIGSNMCQNKIITETDGKFITSLGLENSSAKVLEPNTVLVALVGATIGKVGLLHIPASTNQNIGFIKQNPAIALPLYLLFVIKNLYSLFTNIGNGKFKMANLSFIRNLPIMLPPLSLQEKFASRIEQIEKQKKELEKTIANMQTLLDSRMDYWFG